METLSHYFQIYFILLAFISLFLIIFKNKISLKGPFMEASKNTFLLVKITVNSLWNFMVHFLFICAFV